MPGKKKRKDEQKRKEQKEGDSTRDTGAMGIDELCESAAEAMGRFAPDAAIEFCQQALTIDGKCTEAIDLMAHALMEMGQGEEAVQWLDQSVQFAPTANPTKYMYLGQLKQGKEALNCFSKGIEVMKTLKDTAGDNMDDDVPVDWNREISSALCSISELYTTDLCDEEVAESECERCLQEAIAICEENPEAHYGLGNLRLIQGRADEAVESAAACLSLLTDGDEDEEAPEWCTYEFRTTVVKLAFELEMYEAAVELCERLLREDDRFVEIWYLAGMCYKRNDDVVMAHDYLTRGIKMVDKATGRGGDEPEVQNAEGEVSELEQLRSMLVTELAQINETDLKEAIAKAEREEAEGTSGGGMDM